MKVKNIVGRIVLGFVFLLCILLLALFLSVKSAVNDPLFESAVIYQPAPTPGSALDAIEADAGIIIPPSAREIHAVVSGFRELDTWVRFDLPVSELAPFIETTYCESPLVSIAPELHTPGDLSPDWWEPHKATDLVVCEGGHSFLRQRILVDRTDPQVFTVFVFSIVDNFATPTSSE
jgi:hypothetical protein